MISFIHITNFKSLKNIYLKPSYLNLCFGMNGMGKSSLLQVFLLLRQSFFKGILQENGLLLQGGNLVAIGRGKDVFYQNAGKYELMTIEIKDTNGTESSWQFRYENAADILPLQSFETSSTKFKWQQISLFSSQFHYFSAEHLSPQTIYPKSEFEVTRHKNIGIKGEYAVHYLSHFGSTKINHPNLRHPYIEESDESAETTFIEKSRYFLHETDELRFNGQATEGLAVAYIYDTIAISFPVNEVWQKVYIAFPKLVKYKISQSLPPISFLSP